MKKISVFVLLCIAFGAGYYAPRFLLSDSYEYVDTNWIRTENMAFTIETTDVTCTHFTISILGFFSESMATEIINSPQKYLKLYTKMQIETNPPVNLISIDETMYPFGYYANAQTQTFSINPPLELNQNIHVNVLVTFNEFSNILRPVPFELDLVGKNCP